MNFTESSKKRKSIIRHMSVDDVVIAYDRHDKLDHFILQKSGIYQNRFGAFHHDDMLGLPFGSRVSSRTSDKSLYLLEPSPELWNLSVDFRTQIVNEVDQSLIVLNLDLFSGCRVLESGTGSGCMTMNFSRAVGPSGHVYTYEYNKFRAEEASKDFKKLHVDSNVTVQVGNVCGPEGFPGVEKLSIDAIFLDLPQPWLALDHALELLKPNRPICLYSPCMEQVMKSCEKLRSLQFYNIRMFEMKQKEMDSRQVLLEKFDLGHEASLNSNSNSNSDNSSSSNSSSNSISNNSSNMPVYDEDSPSLYNKEYISNFIASVESETQKRKKAYEDERNRLMAIHPHLQAFCPELETMVNQSVRIDLPPFSYKHASKPAELPSTSHLVARTESIMKTHTAYLTFAMRPSQQTIELAAKEKETEKEK